MSKQHSCIKPWVQASGINQEVVAWNGVFIPYVYDDWGKLTLKTMLPLPEKQQILAPYLLLAA